MIRPRSISGRAAAAAGVLAVLAPAPVLAAEAPVGHGVRVAAGASAGGRSMELGLGKAVVLDLPADARDVLVSDPDVADAVMRTARRVFVIGRKLGQTNLFFFDAQGRQIAALELVVGPDLRALEQVIAAAAPDAVVNITTAGGGLVLTGQVASQSERDRIQKIAQRFAAQAGRLSSEAGAAAEDEGAVVNLLEVREEEQVLVKVRVVEMTRSLVKQLGVNLSAENILNQFLPEDVFVKVATENGYSIAGTALGGIAASGGVADNILVPQTVGVGSLGQLNGFSDQTFGFARSAPVSEAGVGGYAYTGPTPTNPSETYTFGPGELVTKSRVDGSIEAFERAGLLRVLAEPNLTSVSGESARFLAGGEFPIPVGQDDGRISIEFKPFGVGLAVTPVVLSKGRISLKLATEVSELTNEGAIQAESILIPALQVRRAETTVEVPSGGAIMMAGLIQERTRQALEGVPGAKDIPVFGSLFRSRDFLSSESELVIIVTPYLVKPADPRAMRTPLDGFDTPNDFNAIVRGKLNGIYRSPASDAEPVELAESVGFVIPDPNDPGAERLPPPIDPTQSLTGDAALAASTPPRKKPSGSNRP